MSRLIQTRAVRSNVVAQGSLSPEVLAFSLQHIDTELAFACVQLVGALQKLDSNCLIDTAEGLETLLVYITNVFVKPQEKRYRKIRLSNVNYIERLGHLTGEWPTS